MKYNAQTGAYIFRSSRGRRVVSVLLISVLSAASLLLVASCTQGTYGIFASLERETKITDRGLDNGITPTAMTKAGGYYYLSANVMYVRATDSTSWAEVSPPVSGQESNGVAYNSGATTPHLFAVFYDSSGNYAVYYRASDGTTAASGWTETNLKTDNSSVFSIGGLFYINSTLYATVQTGDSSSYGPAYSLYQYNTSTSQFDPITASNAPDSDYPVIDATYSGSTAWFLTKGALYSLSGGTWTQVVPADSSSNAYSNFDGIYYDDGTITGSASLWVTAGTDLIESTDNGSSWTAVVSSQTGPDGSTALTFTRIDGFSSSSYKALIVGTQSYGYYLYHTASSTSSLVLPDSTSNYSASSLATSSISLLWVDTNPPQTVNGSSLSSSEANLPFVFAGGALDGLWECYYGSSSPTWVQD